jgi:ribose transport system substrate-binding protein
MNRIKTTSAISIAGLLCAGLLTSAVQAANAPDWLGGKLTKPLAETRIGITVLYPGSNAYQAKYAETAVSYAKELGIDATVMDPQGDPAVQFNQIEDMVSQNLDVIVLWPTSQNALIPAVRQAARAGIPVITSNSPIGEAGRRYIKAHTGPDDCAQAEQAAEMLGDSLNGKGNIVVVEGTPGYSVSILRKNCFLDKIEDAYPNVNILASQSADWNREKAQTVMETFLTKFGNDIDGVYAFDDGMGLGVISALQAKGKKPGDVKVVTCNLFGEGWDAIKTGWETGSNKQSAEDDAILAIQTAVKIAHGIDVPVLAQIETPKIQANNVNQFERPSW